MNFNIILTSKCNLKCKYCYEGHNKSHKDMGVDTASKVIDFIVKTLCSRNEPDRIHRVIFHGGEPFLNYELMKFIKYKLDEKVSQIHKITYMTTTNGTILNDEKIEFIKKNNIFLSISIDGTKEMHDQNRIYQDGTGSYAIMVKNLDKLKKQGLLGRARMTYSSSSVSSLYEGIVNISDLGFDLCVPAADFYDSGWNDENIDILEKEIDKIINDANLKNISVSMVNKQLLCKEKSDCFGGITNITISEDGDLYPCLFTLGEKKFIIGNIMDDEMINKNKVKKIFEEILTESNDCNPCNAQAYCFGNQCKLLNYMVTGKYNTPPYINCRLMEVELNTYKKLKKGSVENA